MSYKVEYKVKDIMQTAPLGSCFIEGEIGARFDRFIYERISSNFAIEEILREAEDFFATQYDDIYTFGSWRSEFWGKLMLSAVRCCKYKNDEKLKESLKRSCYKILSLQRKDGYLSTYRNSDNIYPYDVKKSALYSGWENDYCWNIWGMKYTLWGLIEAYDYLDDEQILSGAVKLADWIIAKFEADGKRVKDSGVMDGLPSCSILKPMLILYKITADDKYLKFGQDIVKEWSRDDNERPNLLNNALSKKPVAEWYDINDGWLPKAYEMTSCFDGILELYRLTGDRILLEASKSFYETLVKYESNILGSAGYCERYHNAADYADAATEVCDVIHWMRLCHELFKITGNIKYINSFEKAFLNAFLAGVYSDGKSGAFFVRSAGRHWNAVPQCETKYQHCCLNNVGRGFANAAETAVTENEKGYYINLYNQSYVKFEDTEICVGSGYIDGGSVGLSVRNPKPGKKLYLRVPEWSKNTKLRINLDDEIPVKCGEYYEVKLNPGTTILKIRFDMTVQVIERKWSPIPDGDYHLVRWVDSVYGVCNKESMLKSSKIVLRRGPVILARTKRFGAEESDMFTADSLYGKSVTKITAPQLKNNSNCLVVTRVNIAVDGKSNEYVMCDYASAANFESDDAKFFSIYL